MGWDEILPRDIQTRFEEWKQEIKLVTNLTINRCLIRSSEQEHQLHVFCDASKEAYGAVTYIRSFDGITVLPLVFCLAKFRLAPVKELSIPKLELMAALIGARLARYVKSNIRAQLQTYMWSDSQIVISWVTSKRFLKNTFVNNRVGEIKRISQTVNWHHCPGKANPADLSTRSTKTNVSEVCNRWLKGPQWLLLKPEQWEQAQSYNDDIPPHEGLVKATEQEKFKNMKRRAVTNSLSLSDDRQSTKTLYTTNCQKLAGPQFNSPSPQTSNYQVAGKVYEKHKNQIHQVYLNQIAMTDHPLSENVSYNLLLALCSLHSSFDRTVRKISWIYRARNRFKMTRQQRVDSAVTSVPWIAEFKETETWIVKGLQDTMFQAELYSLKNNIPISKQSSLYYLNPFLDKDNLLRVTGRLQLSSYSYEMKHPLLLPRSKLTDNIILTVHYNCLHQGESFVRSTLRAKFWIPSFSRTVRNALKKCPVCRLYQVKTLTQMTAPLPRDRIEPTLPFTAVGMDHVGPFHCLEVNKMQKVYLVLFSCASSRGLHLEVVRDMNSSSLINAVRRLGARRGIPNSIYCDNGKTFAKLDQNIQQYRSMVMNRQLHSYLFQNNITFYFNSPKAPWWGGFWERMVRTLKNTLRMTIGKRVLPFDDFQTFLCEVEATINDRPLCVLTDDPSSPDILTPSMLMNGRLYGHLPPIPDEACKKDELQRSLTYRRRMLTNYLNVWKKEYILQLRTIQQSTSQASTQLKADDVIVLHEHSALDRSWRIGRVLLAMPGRDGRIRSCRIKLIDGSVVTRPIQSLALLEASPGSETSIILSHFSS
ncbi:hypothetical protein CHUAL_014256 [Chamberlinius hualienensis]